MHTQTLSFTNGKVNIVIEPVLEMQEIDNNKGTVHHVGNQYVRFNIHRPDGTVSQLNGMYGADEQLSITSPWLWNTINMLINSPKWTSTIMQHNGAIATQDQHLPEDYK